MQFWRYSIRIIHIHTWLNHGATLRGLPTGITLADLKVEHHSILRNPDIAQMCFIRKYIEMLGSGTLRMIDDCKRNKFKLPVWKERDNTTTVIFPDVAHNRITEGITEGVIVDIERIIERIIEGAIEGISIGIRTKMTIIILALYKTPGVKIRDIEKRVNIPPLT